MTQPNDNTFTTAGELIDLHVDPSGQKPNTIDPDLVKKAKQIRSECKVFSTAFHITVNFFTPSWCHVEGNLNRSSTLQFSVRAIFNARTVEGTYTPFSMALMLLRDTSAKTDKSCWVMLAALRCCSRRLCNFLWSLPTFSTFHIPQPPE